MAMIEREALLSAAIDVEVNGVNISAVPAGIIRYAPTIDPIRAAGGCRCGECKHHKPIDYCGLHRTTGWFSNRYCSYSELREEQNDE